MPLFPQQSLKCSLSSSTVAVYSTFRTQIDFCRISSSDSDTEGTFSIFSVDLVPFEIFVISEPFFYGDAGKLSSKKSRENWSLSFE